MNKGQKLLKKQKNYYWWETSYYQKELKYLLPISGQRTLRKLKVVKYGTLMEKILRFCWYGCNCLFAWNADNYVNTKVKLAIDKASLTTLNSKDEIQLAQSLIKIHRWADMAKFCKSGGESLFSCN